jgi:hypothetical protein
MAMWITALGGGLPKPFGAHIMPQCASDARQDLMFALLDFGLAFFSVLLLFFYPPFWNGMFTLCLAFIVC